MKNNTSNANKLAITQGKGFGLSFDNGYTLSVQIGTMNYCDNYIGMGYPTQDESEQVVSTTCEMAIIDKNGDLIVWPDGSGESYDTVGGYIPIADLPKWIAYVSAIKAPSK